MITFVEGNHSLYQYSQNKRLKLVGEVSDEVRKRIKRYSDRTGKLERRVNK